MNETFGQDIWDALVDSTSDSLIGETEKPKNIFGSYRPKLHEGGHPSSMSKPRPVFILEEIDALGPEIVRVFAELRKGEHLTLRSWVFGSQSQGGAKWKEAWMSPAWRFDFALPESSSASHTGGNLLGLLRGVRPQVSGQGGGLPWILL